MGRYPIYSIQRFNCTAVNSNWYSNTFENHLKTHAFVEQAHRHNSYLLLFFTNGSGTHEIDFNEYQIQSGSMFFLQPGQMHHWNLSNDAAGYVVIYSQELYNLYFGQKSIADYPFYSGIDTKPELLLQEEERLSLVPLFEKLIQEGQSEAQWKQDYCLNLLDSIHIEVGRKYIQTNDVIMSSYNLKLKQFEADLERYFKTEKSPTFYADKLNISFKHLNRICNDMLFKTTTEVITDRIMLEAKRMLLDQNFSFNQLAFELGYENYPYFSRLFKKYSGVSPRIFRETHNKK